MLFDLYPILFTERLILEQPGQKDVSIIFQLRSNAEVNRYIDRPPAKDPEEARQFIERINKNIEEQKSLYWMIRLRENHETIGTICLWNFSPDQRIAETGYELLPVYQSKGYMQEALQVVSAYAFNRLLLHRIEAHTHRDNTASKHLLEKKGFQRQDLAAGHENPNEWLYFLVKK